MRVLDVGQLHAYVNLLLDDDAMLQDLWLQGEVSNLVRASSGHIYFALNSDQAKIECALFRGNQRGMRTTLNNGDAVLAHGRVATYAQRSQVQLIVDQVAPQGIGLQQLLFEQRFRLLEAEGLFAEERKRPLPRFPKTIGVVTSATGAVWHDIQQVIKRRYPAVRLVLSPSLVQGDDAPTYLIRALKQLDELGICDVIIIARGGGSAEDLSAFNDDLLARAIFGVSCPVVSAVGHETDVTIADHVADVRAPTPSAAAEMCVPNRAELLEGVRALSEQVRERCATAISAQRSRLALTRSDLRAHHPRTAIAEYRRSVDRSVSNAQTATHALRENYRTTVQLQRERAALLDPRDVLRRGYVYVARDEHSGTGGQRVTSAAEIQPGDHLTLTFRDGTVRVDGADRNHA